MKAPRDKEIAFTFVSHPNKDARLRWQAVLSFPPGADATTRLPLTVVDGNNAPVVQGVFELAGQAIEITNGKGELTFADFVAGRHETALWLHLPGSAPIPGGLTFR